MLLPFDRERLKQRNALDAEQKEAVSAEKTPSQRFLETVEVSDVVRQLAVAPAAMWLLPISNSRHVSTFARSWLPFSFRHRRQIEVFGRELWVIAPEELFLLKAFSDRSRDFEDLVGLASMPKLKLDERKRFVCELFFSRAAPLVRRFGVVRGRAPMGTNPSPTRTSERWS